MSDKKKNTHHKAIQSPHDSFVKKAKRLPVIVPLVFYHGTRHWRVGTRLSDLIEGPREDLKAYIPDFSYLLCDLSPYGNAQIKGAAILRVFLMLLKYIHHPELAVYLRQILPLLKEREMPYYFVRVNGDTVKKGVYSGSHLDELQISGRHKGAKAQRHKIFFFSLCASVPALSVAYTTGNRYKLWPGREKPNSPGSLGGEPLWHRNHPWHKDTP